MQPKQYTTPKIALLNIELELKAERDNAEVRLENVEVISHGCRQANTLIPSLIRRSIKKWWMPNGQYYTTSWKSCI